MHATTIAVDLAKDVFELALADQDHRLIARKRLSREHSSGRHRHLGRMSKRGDGYLRMLLIHGARAVLRAAQLRQRRGDALTPLQQWALALQQRQGHNKAAVGLANKLARRLWAMTHHGRDFDAHHCSTRPVAKH
jgi:transposase